MRADNVIPERRGAPTGRLRRRLRAVATVAGVVVGAAALALPAIGPASANDAANQSPTGQTGTGGPGHHGSQGHNAISDHPLPAPPKPPQDRPGQPDGYQDPTALTAGGGQGQGGHGRGPVSSDASETATFGSDGPDPVLVVYDDGTIFSNGSYTTDQYGYLGQEYAVEAGNLASHFGKVTIEPAKSYTAGQAASFNAIIYVGSTYGAYLPTTFLNDALSTSHPVIWLGDNVWQLSGNSGGAANTAFRDKYGWDASSSYFDSSDTLTQVTYKGQTFIRNTSAGPLLAPHITNAAAVTSLAQALCADSTGATVTCTSNAQTTGSTFPWAIQSANLTYVGEVPLSYISETDRYLVLSDLLFPALAPSAPVVHNAMLRLEDVSAKTDGAGSGNISGEMTWLEQNQIPFSVNVIPDYLDPNGFYSGGTAVAEALNQNTALVNDLKKAVSSHYGFINQEGYTHQYSNIANPYDAVTGDDFEFFRAWCSTTEAWPPPQPDPNGCPNTDWVNMAGPLPSSVDTTKLVQGRINSGLAIINKASLPKPNNYIMPHYAGSLLDYKTINPMFRDSYDRKIYFPSQLGGSPDYTTHPPYGQFFPYPVTDIDGAITLPENLGEFEPIEQNNHPPRSVADITHEAQLNSVFTNGTASFFFDPEQNDPSNNLTPLQVLQQLVANIKGLGYTFVSPDTEFNQYKSFLASAPPPNPNPMSVTGLTPNTGPAAGGNNVTVSGSGFSAATTLTWGGQSVPFTISSGSTITLTAPAQGSLPATVDVVVSGGGHTSPTSSADQYTYQAPPPPPPPPGPAPTITAVNPSSVPDATPTTVVLTGQNFTGATSLSFCGDAESFTVNSDTQITTTSPTTTYVGACWITVTTPNGTSPQQNNMTFTSSPPPPSGSAPTITTVNPSSVSGSHPGTVVLSGQSFTGATQVDFCGVDMTFTVNSDTQITTSSPSSTYVGPCWITVTTPGGTSPQQNNVTFTS